MEIKALIDALEGKVIQGEYGPWNRPFVTLDIDEYRAVLEALGNKPKRGRPRKDVPRETIRDS